MLANGWRWGTLKIQVHIHQAGSAVETSPSGKTESHWETAIQGESTQQVLVAPDLQILVPDEGDEESRHSAFKSEPYYVSETSAPANITGSVTNTLRWNNLSPNSNDFISLTRAMDETGEVIDLEVESMHPSLYGIGQEVRVRIGLGTHSITTETAQPANGGTPVVTTAEADEGPTFSFVLYPVPNPDTLNDYPFWDLDTPADLIEQERQGHRETLSLLNQIQAGAVPVMTDLRTGLRTTATKDTLELNYEYAGNKQVAFMMGLESFIGEPSPNVLRISITLSADQ
jgi:hypothetical protein